MGAFGVVLAGTLAAGFGRTAGLWGRALWVTTGASFLIAAVIAAGMTATRRHIPSYVLWDSALYLWLLLGTAVGFVILLVGHLKGRTPRSRAIMRQILWAFPLGVGIPVGHLILGHIGGLTEVNFQWNLFLLLLPLATADAIVRKDLLATTRVQRRFVGSMTVALAVGMGVGAGLWLFGNFLGVDDIPGMVVLAAFLFTAGVPVAHRIQLSMDRLLRPGVHRAAELLSDFSARASTTTRLDDLLGLTSTVLSETVHPGWLELLVPTADNVGLLPLLDPERFVPDGAVLKNLLQSREATFFDSDAALATPHPPGGPEAPELPKALKDAALALPLVVADEAVGLLVLGRRADGMSMDGDDLAFLQGLAGPLAAALVNAQAFARIENLNLELESRVAARTQELAEKNLKLAQLNARKDELVATVSHDFRTPLAVIRQNVQTLLRDHRIMEAEDRREFLEAVARQEERLTTLCTQLLDLARLKDPTFEKRPVDFLQVIEAALSAQRQKIQERGIQVDWAEPSTEGLAPKPWTLQGDETRLYQVVQNLLDNALRHAPEGGKVTVHLTASDGPAGLALEVGDSGKGLAKDEAERVFEPFFQGSDQVGGSGLGLAIVSAVVHAHDGRVTAENGPGGGALFRVFLPTQAADEGSEGHAA
jgi:signal transduction histidine kinase